MEKAKRSFKLVVPLVILMLWLGRAAPLRAEGVAEPSATFFSAPTRVRLVAGPWTRLTLLGGEDLAIVAGGGGGFVLYDHLLVMAYACSRGGRTAPGDGTREFSLAGWGGQLAWIARPHARLHLNVAALLGRMSATVTAKADANDTARLDYLSFEPYGEVEASLYAGLKVFAGAGYRIVTGTARQAGQAGQAGIDSSYLRGPTLELGFRMGG